MKPLSNKKKLKIWKLVKKTMLAGIMADEYYTSGICTILTESIQIVASEKYFDNHMMYSEEITRNQPLTTAYMKEHWPEMESIRPYNKDYNCYWFDSDFDEPTVVRLHHVLNFIEAYEYRIKYPEKQYRW